MLFQSQFNDIPETMLLRKKISLKLCFMEILRPAKAAL